MLASFVSNLEEDKQLKFEKFIYLVQSNIPECSSKFEEFVFRNGTQVCFIAIMANEMIHIIRKI